MKLEMKLDDTSLSKENCLTLIMISDRMKLEMKLDDTSLSKENCLTLITISVTNVDPLPPPSPKKGGDGCGRNCN